PCGETYHNCMVMADGRIDPLGWSADPDVLIAADTAPNGALLVPPGAKTDLLLSLELSQMLYSSGAEPLKPRIVLAGRAAAGRRPTARRTIRLDHELTSPLPAFKADLAFPEVLPASRGFSR